MKKTLVIYNVNGEPMEAFEYDDNCQAAKAEAVRIIRQAQKRPDFGRYERYDGAIAATNNR